MLLVDDAGVPRQYDEETATYKALNGNCSSSNQATSVSGYIFPKQSSFLLSFIFLRTAVNPRDMYALEFGETNEIDRTAHLRRSSLTRQHYHQIICLREISFS